MHHITANTSQEHHIHTTGTVPTEQVQHIHAIVIILHMYIIVTEYVINSLKQKWTIYPHILAPHPSVQSLMNRLIQGHPNVYVPFAPTDYVSQNIWFIAMPYKMFHSYE